MIANCVWAPHTHTPGGGRLRCGCAGSAAATAALAVVRSRQDYKSLYEPGRRLGPTCFMCAGHYMHGDHYYVADPANPGRLTKAWARHAEASEFAEAGQAQQNI